MRIRQKLAALSCIVVFGLGCLALLTGCPSGAKTPQFEQPRPTETYVHEPSGFSFPATLGNLVRDTMKMHDAEGRSISCGYHLLQLCNFRVHVYPVQQEPPDDTLENAFKAAQEEIEREHQGAKRVKEETVTRMVSKKKREGKHAVFSYKAVYLQRNQTMITELFLYQKGEWFVKYLATYAEGEREVAPITIDAFLDQSFLWPEGAAKEDEHKKP